MANFTELNCFNKLLLQKMERLQKENNELKKRFDNAIDHLDESEVRRCKKCKFYFDNGDVDEVNELYNDVSIYCYDNGCIHDVSWSCYECESYYANGTPRFNDCCKECYLMKIYPQIRGHTFRNYNEVVGKIQSMVGTMTVANKAMGRSDTIFKPSWMNSYYYKYYGEVSYYN